MNWTHKLIGYASPLYQIDKPVKVNYTRSKKRELNDFYNPRTNACGRKTDKGSRREPKGARAPRPMGIHQHGAASVSLVEEVWEEKKLESQRGSEQEVTRTKEQDIGRSWPLWSCPPTPTHSLCTMKAPTRTWTQRRRSRNGLGMRSNPTLTDYLWPLCFSLKLNCMNVE